MLSLLGRWHGSPLVGGIAYPPHWWTVVVARLGRGHYDHGLAHVGYGGCLLASELASPLCCLVLGVGLQNMGYGGCLLATELASPLCCLVLGVGL
jgi:hypothetical protein